MIKIFKKFRDPNIRWYRQHREQAVTLRKWLFPLLAGALTLGIILTVVSYVTIKPICIKNRQVKLISELILKYNKDFEQAWLKPTAKYIAKNSSPFDPVLMASIFVNESAGKRTAESDAGAVGFFQIKPTGDERKIPKKEWLQLAFQLEKAKERLLYFYENYDCKTVNKRKEGKAVKVRVCGPLNRTTLGMHYGYVGLDKNHHIANFYVARIYTDENDVSGWVWKKRPKTKEPPKK